MSLLLTVSAADVYGVVLADMLRIMSLNLVLKCNCTTFWQY